MVKKKPIDHIICQKCGAEIPVSRGAVNATGRPKLNIALKNVYKGLQATQSRDGKPNYTAAARWLAADEGIKASGGYVWIRIGQEAEARQISREELLGEILRADESNNLSAS